VGACFGPFKPDRSFGARTRPQPPSSQVVGFFHAIPFCREWVRTARSRPNARLFRSAHLLTLQCADLEWRHARNRRRTNVHGQSGFAQFCSRHVLSEVAREVGWVDVRRRAPSSFLVVLESLQTNRFCWFLPVTVCKRVGPIVGPTFVTHPNLHPLCPLHLSSLM